MRFKGVIFDMDGTLTVPIIDFQKMRDDLGIPVGDIAVVLNSRPEAEQRNGWKIVEEYEQSLASQNRLQEGVIETFRKIRGHGVHTAILTRNSHRSVEIFLERFELEIDCYLGRDYDYIKPSPIPLQHIISKWGLEPQECLMVGDYIHDIECGKAAGTCTCFFQNEGHESYAEYADFCATNYSELERIILG